MSSIREYYELIKPGIIYSNALTIAAGFFLGVKGPVNLFLLLETIVGVGLVAAASCVVNNYLDRDIDAKMERTSGRALARGRVSNSAALTFAILLLLLGVLVLYIFTNLIALLIALAGFCIYIFLYTPAKRRSIHALHIGSLAGAVPPVAGYVAMNGTFDIGALALLLILVLWQIPHFFSIGIYREKEYTAADIPIAATVIGMARTRTLIVLYVALFSIAALMLHLIGMMNYWYAATMAVVCLAWFALAIAGFFARDTRRWARKMFWFSLVVIVVWSVTIILTRLAS